MPYKLPLARIRSTDAQDRAAHHRQLCTARWQKLRRYKLSLNPLCEQCAEKGIIAPAKHIHHKISRRLAPELIWEYTNLESLCETHHNRIKD